MNLMEQLEKIIHDRDRIAALCRGCWAQPRLSGIRWCAPCRRRIQGARMREMIVRGEPSESDEAYLRNYKFLDLSPEVVAEVEAFLKSRLPF